MISCSLQVGTYRQPLERSHVRQVDPEGFVLLNFMQNSGRNEDAPGESRQNMEKSELIEILERRCVADDFRQSKFLYGVARR